jgi:hypothetical protein
MLQMIHLGQSGKPINADSVHIGGRTHAAKKHRIRDMKKLAAAEFAKASVTGGQAASQSASYPATPSKATQGNSIQLHLVQCANRYLQLRLPVRRHRRPPLRLKESHTSRQHRRNARWWRNPMRSQKHSQLPMTMTTQRPPPRLQMTRTMNKRAAVSSQHFCVYACGKPRHSQIFC